MIVHSTLDATPENAVQWPTECPSWCTVDGGHTDDVLVSDPEVSVTEHFAEIADGPGWSINYRREDHRNGDDITLGSAHATVTSEDLTTDADGLRALASAILTAADIMDGLANLTDTAGTSNASIVDTFMRLEPENLELVVHLNDTRRKRFGFVTAADCDGIAAWVSHQVDRDLWLSVARQLRESGHQTIDAAFAAGMFRAED